MWQARAAPKRLQGLVRGSIDTPWSRLSHDVQRSPAGAHDTTSAGRVQRLLGRQLDPRFRHEANVSLPGCPQYSSDPCVVAHKARNASHAEDRTELKPARANPKRHTAPRSQEEPVG
jgi:hypothetical protein